jgi:hypothetical protein
VAEQPGQGRLGVVGEDRDRQAGLVRGIDAPRMDVSRLPNERRRFLAQVARRSTNQGLERRKERKYPILLAFVAQAAVDQLDEVVALFDQAVSARESRAKSKTEEALAERAKKGDARQLLMDVIRPDGVPGLLHPRGRAEAEQVGGGQAEHPGGADRDGHQPGAGPHVGGLRGVI